MDRGPKPLEFPELAEMAHSSLMASWDRNQPLKRYIAAVRQLLQESKVYLKEGDYDKAFVFSVKIHTLTTELLPKQHPQWAMLNEEAKKVILREADRIVYQINDLKGLIQDRNDAWTKGVPPQAPTPVAITPRTVSPVARHPSPSPVTPASPNPPSPSVRPPAISAAPGSSVALTLRNTVQPAQMSMSSNPSTSPLPALTPKYPPKENMKSKIKRKFGVSKKLPVGSGVLPEPGTAIEEDMEEEAKSDTNEEGWVAVAAPTGTQASAPPMVAMRDVRHSTPRDGRMGPYSSQQVYGLERARTAPARSNGAPMPLPGEDEEEDGIVFHSGHPPSQPSWSPQIQHPPLHRPPSIGSVSSVSSYHSIPSAPPPQLTYSQWPPGVTPAPNQYPHQLYSQAPPAPWLSNAFSNPPPPPGPPPPLAPPSMGAGLVRSPSRLTISHQQQQGYSPSNLSSATVPHAPMPLPTVHGNQVQAWNQPAHPPGDGQASYSQSTYSMPNPNPAPNQFNKLPSRASAPPLPPYPASANPHANAPRPTAFHRTPSDSEMRTTSQAPSAPPSAAPSAPSPSPTIAPRQLARTSSMSLAALPQGLIRPRWTNARKPHTGQSALEVAGLAGLKQATVVEEVPEEDELTKTEGGQPLRHMQLPMELISAFIQLAAVNTNKGIETCGLLMGTLSYNTFTITNLLIPKQVGTTDTCTTTHEEEQFAFQDKRDLMTLGWIHTHPTQSCFMSSLDLHTHSSYQVMLAEAIAIVCAPKHEPSFGIFRLTDPPGLETIVKCDVPGAFHPHPDLPIYTDTDHGHVQLRSRLRFESHDLRGRS